MSIRRIGTGIVGVTLLGAGMVVAQTARPATRATPATRPTSTVPAPTTPTTTTRSTTASAPATRPTNARDMSADQLLGQMLRPPAPPAGAGPRVLQPIESEPAPQRDSGMNAVQPGAPLVPVLREGTFIPERTGRLTRSPDGRQAEFTFDSDGKALRDPPLVILPSLKLVAMENAVTGTNRDLKFRISGTITEYRGRNYILLEKVVVIPDAAQQF